jgi:hypothetical protein
MDGEGYQDLGVRDVGGWIQSPLVSGGNLVSRRPIEPGAGDEGMLDMMDPHRCLAYHDSLPFKPRESLIPRYGLIQYLLYMQRLWDQAVATPKKWDKLLIQ